MTGAVVAVASLAALAAPALAASSPAESATADFMSGPFHVQFNAQRAANAPATSATGSFIAHSTVGTITVATLQGPVTCLDVRGNEMGLFYPVTSSDPSLLGMLAKGVFIYVTVSQSTGQAQAVSFIPSLSAAASSCAPLPGLFPITAGTATLTG
jgi:hypothetical protein